MSENCVVNSLWSLEGVGGTRRSPAVDPYCIFATPDNTALLIKRLCLARDHTGRLDFPFLGKKTRSKVLHAILKLAMVKRDCRSKNLSKNLSNRLKILLTNFAKIFRQKNSVKNVKKILQKRVTSRHLKVQSPLWQD